MLASILPSATPAQLGASDRIDRILRASRAALAANPRIAGLAPTPPTITDNGATRPAQTPQPYVLSVGAPGVWTIVGGTPVAPNAGLVRPYSTIIGTTGGTVGSNDGKNASFWRLSAMAASRYVALSVGPTTAAYRFLVDDRYVSTAGTVTATTSGPAGQYLLLDFGTGATRKITVEGQSACSLYAAFVENTGRMWPVDSSDALYVSFLGDSYVYGSAANALGDGVAPVMGNWMGARMHASGSVAPAGRRPRATGSTSASRTGIWRWAAISRMSSASWPRSTTA